MLPSSAEFRSRAVSRSGGKSWLREAWRETTPDDNIVLYGELQPSRTTGLLDRVAHRGRVLGKRVSYISRYTRTAVLCYISFFPSCLLIILRSCPCIFCPGVQDGTAVVEARTGPSVWRVLRGGHEVRGRFGGAVRGEKRGVVYQGRG